MALATYIKKGNVVEYTNSGSAIVAWEIVILGSRIAVAADAIAATSGVGNLFLEGTFQMPAVNTETWAIGDAIYWDNSAKKLQKTATAYFAGMCVAAKAETAALGQIQLCDSTVPGAVPTLSISAAELAADAVETAKIKDLNVTAGKLAADAVETAKIKDANVTVGKLDTPLQALVLGAAAGYKIARGITAVTGTNDLTTGLATVVAFACTLAEDPSADATIATAVLGAAGHITLKVWKPTAEANTAPIAAVLAKNVSWIAIGT